MSTYRPFELYLWDSRVVAHCTCWPLRVLYVDWTSPFHHFGLMAALASAWTLTWYRSRRSSLGFCSLSKNCCCPLYVHVQAFWAIPMRFQWTCWPSRVTCERGCWSVHVNCLTLSSVRTLVALASAWSLTRTNPPWLRIYCAYSLLLSVSHIRILYLFLIYEMISHVFVI